MRLVIRDIKHSGFSGIKGTSKLGDKYEERKGYPFNCDPEEWKEGDFLHLPLERPGRGGIVTTPFKRLYEMDGMFCIETVNSIYECEVLTKLKCNI